MSKLQIDTDFLQRTLQRLVRINSVNPALVEGAPGEREIGDYTAAVLRELGLQVAQHEPAPGRCSVVGTLAGSGGGRSLMLNAHLDTVGVEGMPDPFAGDIRDGRLYGRGSYDMKGALAACLAAAKAIQDAGVTLRGDLLIAAVADEEHASLGTADLIGRYAVDGAVVTEPTHGQTCLAHKGFVWIRVETAGRAAHGSQPSLGVDANLRMGRFLAELAHLERELRARTPHPLVGPPSLHAATVHGGTGLSTYADRCVLEIERRTVPGETAEEAVGEVRKLADRLQQEDAAFECTVEMLLAREPFEIGPDAAVVRALDEAVQRVLARAPRHTGENPWMDSALLAAAGIETVVFGPAGTGAHAAEEWVELQSVVETAQVLAHMALDYCGTE